MSESMIRAALTLALLALGCGGVQDPRDEPLTAEQHEAEAAREEAEADEHEASFDPERRATSGGGAPNPELHGMDVYNPTAGELVEAEGHREHAHAHRRRAAELRAFEDAECATLPPSSRASCPLLIGLEAVHEIEGGMQLRFAQGIDFSAVVDHVRCHIAFAAARGTEGISHCALYVHGARIEVRGQDVLLTTDASELVADLRRRVRLQAPPGGD